jgi:apolipoprotein N-acyltransferase
MAAFVRVVAALLSAAMLAQAHSLEPIWLVAWAAPIPLLIAVSGATRLGALACGLIAGVGSSLLMVGYFFDLGGIVDAAAIVLVRALIWAILAFCHRTAMQGLPAWAGVFVFPALIAGLETLIAVVSPHGSAGAFAYSQIEFLPVVQAASLAGAPAITFIVCLFASGLAAMVGGRGWTAAVAPVAVVSSLLVWGALRIPAPAAPSAGDVRIALLAADGFDVDDANWRVAWNAYAAETERAAAAGAGVLVLPEKIVRLPEAETETALEQLYDIAARHGAVIVAGVVAQERHAAFNRAWFISGAGIRGYNKRHMVPGFEADLKPGVADLFTDVGDVRIGVAICKDFDFPDLGRRYGSQGASLMLVPAWDFGSDAWLHSRMAVLRGVESGFYVARSAREGLMLVSDPYGRVITQQRSGANVAMLPAVIPQPRERRTLYVQAGDAFGWACLALGLMLALLALVLGWRAEKA